jgi:hypothetical protein
VASTPEGVLDARRRYLREQAWRGGDLTFLLHKGQLDVWAEVLRFINNPDASNVFVLEIARQFGKTYLCLVIALMIAIRTGGRCVYGAPTLQMLREFILPTFDAIADTAPTDIKPRFNAAKSHIETHTGGYIHLFGADDQRKADRGRGPPAEFAVFDEGGNEGVGGLLRYIVTKVFEPAFQRTGGRCILPSTPAATPDHDFTALTEEAEARGEWLHRTIYDNPQLSKERVEEIIAKAARTAGKSVEAFKDSPEFQREYLAKRVIEKSLVVLPEWADKRAALFKAVERPEYFRGMSVLDFGGADPHGLHLAYWHHPLHAYVIEHEDLMVSPCNTLQMQERAKALETEAWGVKSWAGTMAGARDATLHEFRERIPPWMAGILQAQIDGDGQPWMRVCDNDIQLARDLYELHDLAFVPTAKDDKQLQVNNLQVAINREQVYVHPRCVHTDRHWRTTTWADHKRTTYARRGGEHGEFVDTAVYGLRNVDKRDPTPEDARPIVRNQTVGAGIRAELARHEAAQKASQMFMGGTPLGRKLLRGMR